jgi:peptide deformylase
VAVRPVLRLPHAVLKRRSLEAGGESADDLVVDLVDTMRASPACVGLAAPQIGVGCRVIAVDVSAHPKTTTCHGLVIMIDPIVVHSEGKEVGREGCMSVPDLTANVMRARSLVVGGFAPGGERVLVTTEGFEARALQHEIDHLDGLLIVDRVVSAGELFQRRVYRRPPDLPGTGGSPRSTP